MKILLNQFIQFYRLFSSLNNDERERLDKELDNFIAVIKDNNVEDLGSWSGSMLTSMILNYTNLGHLYDKFSSLISNIITEPENLGLVLQDNLRAQLDTFLIMLYNLQEIHKEDIIHKTIKVNDKEYVNKIIDSMQQLQDAIKVNLLDARDEATNKENIAKRNMKTIQASVLAKEIDISRGNITHHHKTSKKFFQNATQTGIGGHLMIPFSDVDEYVAKFKKYYPKWQEYKKKN